MIISHKHKFIFFPIPKTGTHSIRFALRPYLDEQDEEHVALFHHSKFNIEEFKDRNNGHFSVQEIRPHLNEKVWNTYYKFCFVRNPFDRFVSTCFFKNPLIQKNTEKATAIMKLIAKKELKNKSLFYRPQLHYLIDFNGEIAIDFIGKLENMQTDYELICKKINIPILTLDQLNTSTHENYSDYYDKELEQLVLELYFEDFQKFNYKITV
jgi:hypothetical protein